MAYLIIVCPPSGMQPLWRGQGARSPACWQQPGLRAPFFCGDSSSARVLQAQETQRHRPIDTPRTSWSGLYGVRLPDLS
jgi:hypothetical protein